MNYALLDYTNKIKNKILKSPHILETIINEIETKNYINYFNGVMHVC